MALAGREIDQVTLEYYNKIDAACFPRWRSLQRMGTKAPSRCLLLCWTRRILVPIEISSNLASKLEAM